MILSAFCDGGYRYLTYFSEIMHIASLLMCHVSVLTITTNTSTMQTGHLSC